MAVYRYSFSSMHSAGIVVNGCVQVVIPSLEKEFGLSSRQSGIVVAGNDVSAIILICLVSFYGSKANKPNK